MNRLAALQAERDACIGFCRQLTLDQWRTDSAAAGWRVQDVVAHMGGIAHELFSTLMFKMVTARSIERFNDQTVERRKGRAPADVLGEYERWSRRLGRLLAVDLLASAQLLPTHQIDNVTVDSDARRIGTIALGVGYGARVGLIRGIGPLPNLSVSVMRRDIPRITYGDVPGGDRFSYGVDLHATNIRLIASKQVAVVDLAAGLGWDKYTGDAIIQFRDPITSVIQPNVPVELSNSRVLGFLNAGMSLSKVRLTGEVGYQGGKDQELSTSFEDFDTTKGKFFAGLGLRLSF
jgi:hypothetical protein